MNDPFIKEQVHGAFFLLIAGIWLTSLPAIGQQLGKPGYGQRPPDTAISIADTMGAVGIPAARSGEAFPEGGRGSRAGQPGQIPAQIVDDQTG